jgi:hypothetical protein
MLLLTSRQPALETTQSAIVSILENLPIICESVVVLSYISVGAYLPPRFRPVESAIAPPEVRFLMLPLPLYMYCYNMSECIRKGLFGQRSVKLKVSRAKDLKGGIT